MLLLAEKQCTWAEELFYQLCHLRLPGWLQRRTQRNKARSAATAHGSLPTQEIRTKELLTSSSMKR